MHVGRRRVIGNGDAGNGTVINGVAGKVEIAVSSIHSDTHFGIAGETTVHPRSCVAGKVITVRRVGAGGACHAFHGAIPWVEIRTGKRNGVGNVNTDRISSCRVPELHVIVVKLVQRHAAEPHALVHADDAVSENVCQRGSGHGLVTDAAAGCGQIPGIAGVIFEQVVTDANIVQVDDGCGDVQGY